MSYVWALPETLGGRGDREVQAGWLVADELWSDGEESYIKGNIELPVEGSAGPFVWTVWSSLSTENANRALARWFDDGRIEEPPYFGWLSTRIPGYPETLGLKLNVHTQPVGTRPSIEVEPTDHPLALEQRTQIAASRVQELAELLLHEDYPRSTGRSRASQSLHEPG